MLGVEVEVSGSLGEELGDLTVCVDRVAVVAVAGQTVSLVGVAKSVVGHVDGLVVGVAAAAVRVAEAVGVLRGETRVLEVLACDPTPVGHVP